MVSPKLVLHIVTAAAEVNEDERTASCTLMHSGAIEPIPLSCTYSEVDWQRFELEVTDAPPPLEGHLVRSALTQMFPCRIAEYKGVTLLTLPKYLTPDKLEAVARIIDPNFTFRIQASIATRIQQLHVKHTYRILITNNFFEAGINDPLEKQQELIRGYCEEPRLLEVMALIVMKYVYHQKRLFSDITTRCEAIEGCNPIIGGFDGSDVFIWEIQNKEQTPFGMGGVWRFQ